MNRLRRRGLADVVRLGAARETLVVDDVAENSKSLDIQRARSLTPRLADARPRNVRRREGFAKNGGAD